MNKFFENRKKADATALVNALFKEMRVEEAGEPSLYINPSSLNCPVACAFKLTGKPVRESVSSFQSRSYADNGNDRHERIQAFLSQTDYWVDIEQYIKDKSLPLEIIEKQGYEVLLLSESEKVKFKCDGMLLINGEYYVLEIKTERSSINATRTTPNPKHLNQGIAYATLLDVGKIMWIYEGREYLEQKAFSQEVSALEKEQMRQYLQAIRVWKDEPENLERNKSQCNYCDYKDYCRMYFNELKKKELLENV